MTADLLEDIDAAARELLKSVAAPTMGTSDPGSQPQPVDLKDRIAAFEAVTGYLAVKQKLQPPKAGTNGIDRYREHIGGAPRSRTRNKGGAPSAASHESTED